MKAEQVPELGKDNGVLISLPRCYCADDTLPCFGDELGRANVVKVQYYPNCWIYGEAKTDMKGGLIEATSLRRANSMVSPTSRSLI